MQAGHASTIAFNFSPVTSLDAARCVGVTPYFANLKNKKTKTRPTTTTSGWEGEKEGGGRGDRKAARHVAIYFVCVCARAFVAKNREKRKGGDSVCARCPHLRYPSSWPALCRWGEPRLPRHRQAGHDLLRRGEHSNPSLKQCVTSSSRPPQYSTPLYFPKLCGLGVALVCVFRA